MFIQVGCVEFLWKLTLTADSFVTDIPKNASTTADKGKATEAGEKATGETNRSDKSSGGLPSRRRESSLAGGARRRSKSAAPTTARRNSSNLLGELGTDRIYFETLLHHPGIYNLHSYTNEITDYLRTHTHKMFEGYTSHLTSIARTTTQHDIRLPRFCSVICRLVANASIINQFYVKRVKSKKGPRPNLHLNRRRFYLFISLFYFSST